MQQHSWVVALSSLARTSGPVRQRCWLLVPPVQYERWRGDLLPEELDDAARALLAEQLVAAGGAEELGELGVGVLPLQLVASLGERIENPGLVEAVREKGVLRITGHRMEVVEELAHPPVLDLQDALHLVVAERVGPPLGPGGHGQEDVQGLLVGAVHVHVQQTGHDLVERVEGRPHRQSLLQPLHELGGKGREPAPAIGLLALPQLGDEGPGLVLQQLVARAAVRLAARRQVVAHEVAAQLDVGPLPPAELLGRRRESCGPAEGVEQPVRIERVQVDPVAVLERVAGPAQQADLIQGERAGLDEHVIPCCRAAVRLQALCGERLGGQGCGRQHGSKLPSAERVLTVHGNDSLCVRLTRRPLGPPGLTTGSSCGAGDPAWMSRDFVHPDSFVARVPADGAMPPSSRE